MLRLIDVGQNYHILLSEGQNAEGESVFAEVEAALTVFEKLPEISGTRIINVERLTNLRIGMGLETVKMLAKSCAEWISELEKQQATARKAFAGKCGKKQKTLVD